MTYGFSPWIFKGKALYQLSLVPTDEAKKYIPNELHDRIVELFGHTLGGLYLAQYDDSPVGAFDELVVLGGLIWNSPTSCAWASRVYVNNKEARDHGLKSVGLPSRLAVFSLVPSATNEATTTSESSWWRDRASPKSSMSSNSILSISNIERSSRGLKGRPVCNLQLPSEGSNGQMGPRIKLSLPSFSGGTIQCPHLLKYSCDLQTNVMLLPPALVQGSCGVKEQDRSIADLEDLGSVLGGKTVLTLAFDQMEMRVEEPSKLALDIASRGSSSGPKHLMQSN